MKLNVIKAYTREFENPIAFLRGDRVQVGEYSSGQWLGWVYCTAVDGRSGWVAETMLEITGNVGIARRNYSAIELSVIEHESLEGFEIAAGWQWCMNARDEAGWVPLENVQVLS
jgi:Variant SH3 domain